ncbi:hypothetical protein LCGC14_2016740, partial [marine sediment metagenome]
MTQEEIPESVLIDLEVVREDGATNMLARDTVIALVGDLCDDDEAMAWLIQNKSRYMEALTAMGERRTLE